MAVINPIKYQMFNGQMVPNSRPPMIECQSDDVAYGQITINISALSEVTLLTQKVFIVVPPTTDEYRWIRTSPNLYPIHPTCLFATFIINAMNQVVITWEFDPGVILGLNGQYFSLEFFVNQAPVAIIAQSSPKVIIKIKDFLE